MATLIALVDMAAESGGSAERNISERSFLLNRRANLQNSPDKLDRGGGKCRPAPALATSRSWNRVSRIG